MTSATAGPALQKAWHEYHSTLEEMRLLMEATPRFQATPQHRAKAYHTLMEMQAMAYNLAIAPRMIHPRIFVNSGWQTDMHTLGQNGQDFYYGLAFVDGSQTYRLSGRMGDISLFLLQTLTGLFGEEGVKTDGSYDWADFEIGADGRFEIILSSTRHAGNWIRLDPTVSCQFMIIRRALTNWHGDKGDLEMERISELPDDYYDADEFDEAAIAGRIQRAALFVRYLVKDFNINLYDWYHNNAGGKKNVLTLLPGTTTSEGGSPSANYAMAVFELQPDEALIIEMDRVPDGVYWSFQLGDVWSRSLNFSSRQSTLSCAEIIANQNGGFHIVVSQKDPGINNWLDTCGRNEGTLVFRNFRARYAPVPISRKVSFRDLDACLPLGMHRVTADERKHAMAHRRLGMLKLYGE